MTPTQLSKEFPGRLVWLFKAAERSSHRRPGDLLPIACELLRQATDGLVMARGCTRIAFEFEGYRTHALVQVAAIVDSRGEFILDHDRILKWQPDDERPLGDLLAKAAEVFLDGHLPQWRENEGADGQLSVTLSTGLDGALVLVTRGHATVRTMTETTATFPKPS
jgi:hypothetical protein